MTDIVTARLTPELAARYADIALGHVRREYPNKLDHVLDGEADALTPRALHPIFYGSFDWHSCVHGYWMLATLLRLYPDGEAAARITALFDEMLSEEKVAGELAYLQRPSSRGFERPYGWGWLLALQVALQGSEVWAANLRPLAEAFADRFKAFLPRADYPIRTGSHANTAFALRLALDYAEVHSDAELTVAILERADRWYAKDSNALPWEPSGDDFLSPTLVEAQLIARVSAPEPFRTWFGAFLPDVADGAPGSLFQPAYVSDRSDGKIAHLDGLNLTRAWAWRELAALLPPPEAAAARMAAERHLVAALPHVGGDYMGEHWLATYAVLALSAP